MALYNGNNAYLSINSYVVGAASGADSNLFINFEMSLQTGDEDVSAGSGISWERHAPKLSRVNATAQIAYDTDSVESDLAGILSTGKGDIVEVIYGPEGNSAGTPKHQQNFLITQVSGPTINVAKTRAMFEMTMVSDGEPTSNLYEGDTW